jgi:hypothetical protein
MYLPEMRDHSFSPARSTLLSKELSELWYKDGKEVKELRKEGTADSGGKSADPAGSKRMGKEPPEHQQRGRSTKWHG